MTPTSTMVPIAIAIPDNATIFASTPKSFIAIKTINTATGNKPDISIEARRLNTIMIITRMVIKISNVKASFSVPNVSLMSDIKSAFRGELGAITGQTTTGVFISFEGGEGSGKSTQTKLLKDWLEKNNEEKKFEIKSWFPLKISSQEKLDSLVLDLNKQKFYEGIYQNIEHASDFEDSFSPRCICQ